jgi:hypothetical protein
LAAVELRLQAIRCLDELVDGQTGPVGDGSVAAEVRSWPMPQFRDASLLLRLPPNEQRRAAGQLGERDPDLSRRRGSQDAPVRDGLSAIETAKLLWQRRMHEQNGELVVFASAAKGLFMADVSFQVADVQLGELWWPLPSCPSPMCAAQEVSLFPGTRHDV